MFTLQNVNAEDLLGNLKTLKNLIQFLININLHFSLFDQNVTLISAKLDKGDASQIVCSINQPNQSKVFTVPS